MTVITTSARVGLEQTEAKGYPFGTTRFDWIAVILPALIVVGAFISGWAYFHGKQDAIWETILHVAAYGGALA